MSKFNHLFVIAVLAFFISGCTPITVSEEQKKQILAVDPDFKKSLELKDALDVQLADLRSGFLSEKNIYESKAAALRREFEAKRAQFYVAVQQIKSQLDPQRGKLNTQIAILGEELKDRLKSQRAIQSMLKQAKAVIEGKFSRSISEEDKIEWQKRFESMSKESESIAQEIALIKEKLHTLKLKYRSLIQ